MQSYLVTMNSPAGWKNGRPTFEVWKKGDTQSFCECSKQENADKIVNLLNKKEKYVLTLGQLLSDLKEPDHTPTGVDARDLEVVFDTAYRSDLTLLSCYVSHEEGKVHIDIGTGEE